MGEEGEWGGGAERERREGRERVRGLARRVERYLRAKTVACLGGEMREEGEEGEKKGGRRGRKGEEGGGRGGGVFYYYVTRQGLATQNGERGS